MKMHIDGSIEGTPEEVVEYKRRLTPSNDTQPVERQSKPPVKRPKLSVVRSRVHVSSGFGFVRVIGFRDGVGNFLPEFASKCRSKKTIAQLINNAFVTKRYIDQGRGSKTSQPEQFLMDNASNSRLHVEHYDRNAYERKFGGRYGKLSP